MKSFVVKLFINNICLTADELEAVVIEALDRASVCADIISIEEKQVEEVEQYE